MKKIMKKIVLGVLFLSILCSALPMANLSSVEAASATKVVNVNKKFTFQKSSERSSDEDLWYEFTAPYSGYFSFYAKNTLLADSGDADVYIYDEDNHKMYYAELGTKLLETKDMPMIKGHKYYANVKLGWCLNVSYAFKFNATSSKNYESETNDTFKTSDSLKAKKYTYGSIYQYDNSELDYYKFKISKLSKVKITFGARDNVGVNTTWSVKLFNSDNQNVDICSSQKATKTYTYYLPKGTYYIQIKNSYGRGDMYKVKYSASSFSIDTPKIKSVKAGKTIFGENVTTKITLNKKATCDGYQVIISKKNSYKKGKLTNKSVDLGSSATKSKITYRIATKKDKNYYVFVRRYIKDPFGNKVYGKYSKGFKVKK